ncbi:MAG: type I-E CRISPR-associated endoribonuclease Cas2e [Clostridiales bacterium]|nr:type I-E CRISPR-associated endoribonuclease Cas2e [Clostridiales bacterium]
MPFTVITLTNVPNSLRGELTKWMQEIASGVYVGNFNSRVREQLWQHVCDNVQKGEATISYAARNEIGYTFDSYQTKQEVFELDGLPLVRYPLHQRSDENEGRHGFSKAFQSHMRYKSENKKNNSKSNQNSSTSAYVLLDLETTGLDEEKNQIIEIGALKVEGDHTEEFHRLLHVEENVPDFITELTGITTQMLAADGCDRKKSMEDFACFVEDLPLVGYNVRFDIKFLESEFSRVGLDWKNKRCIDILPLVKKEKMFLENYKFSNALASYGIGAVVQHRALEDVMLLAQLLPKLNGFETELKRKG